MCKIIISDLDVHIFSLYFFYFICLKLFLNELQAFKCIQSSLNTSINWNGSGYLQPITIDPYSQCQFNHPYSDLTKFIVGLHLW